MATKTSTYRLSQLALTHGAYAPLYVGGYTENADGSIGYHWTSNVQAASKLRRSVAIRAAARVMEAHAAYRATRDEDFRQRYPLRPIAIRSTTGGMDLDPAAVA